MCSSTENKKIGLLEGIDIICDEWQKWINDWTEEGYIKKETLKHHLVTTTKGKYKLSTNNPKQFKQSLKESLDRLEDKNLSFKKLTDFFIDELFTEKEKTSF